MIAQKGSKCKEVSGGGGGSGGTGGTGSTPRSLMPPSSPCVLAAQDDTVWQNLAAARFPPATLSLAPYDSWQVS